MPARKHLFYQVTADSESTFKIILPVFFVTVGLWTGRSGAFEGRTESAAGRHCKLFGQQFGLIETTFEQSL